MTRARSTVALSLLFAILAAPAALTAQRKPKASMPTALSANAEELETGYQKRLDALRARLQRVLPKVDDAARTRFLRALADVAGAEKSLADAEKALSETATAKALVEHAKGKWIGGADQGIAKAKGQLERAATPEARAAAQQELEKWQQNRRDGEAALVEREAALAAAQRAQPERERAARAAETALEKAREAVSQDLRELGLDRTLTKDTLDDALAEFVVLLEATPRGLATFAQDDRERQALVDDLLGNPALMLRMVTADGARGGAYGRAMEIYAQIHASSETSRSGPLDRLALAIALEHAEPIHQRNAEGVTDAPSTVDPVARYRHYEAARKAGELDANFDRLDTWDYRMIVDGEEPDDVLAWGREMLRSYRPDHVHNQDDRWRYVAAVNTEIRYGSQDNQYDKPELQFFQNILMNGGVCGRRAFFGRFLLRAFGVPTTARPQPGHAALVHWTPAGWVVCLGAGWGKGTTKTRYKSDLDFLATTQARRDPTAYLQVKRAQWIGDVMAEPRVFGLHDGKAPGFWYAVSLHRQAALIEQAGDAPLAAVGEELGEAEDPRVDYANEAATLTAADRAITVAADGTITIPATACSKPSRSGGRVLFLPSNLGGKQLLYGRNGSAQELEYTFEAPRAGRYVLTARVCTPSWQQHLDVHVDGASQAVDLALPHTVGLWATTTPIELELQTGQNVLRLRHRSDGYDKGFAVRDFTLTPGH